MTTNDPVILILVDGMRPDALTQSNAPAINGLLNKGRFSLTAQTVIPSVTLPCITSILFSVPPEVHGTVGNYWNSGDWQAPGIIDLVKQFGGKTASFYNWEQLRDVSHPGSLDVSVCLNHAESQDLPLGESDKQVVDIASSFMVSSHFDFIFVYLGCLDTAGHRHGWMSPEYLQTLENADQCIDKLLKFVPASSHVIVASDHGGHAHAHGSDIPEDMTVPLVISSSKLKPGQLRSPVSVLDIAPTVAYLLGLSAPNEWMGKSLA
jgi:predicted AlkP superfamily pyrophosphatase or phosphodiesterase